MSPSSRPFHNCHWSNSSSQCPHPGPTLESGGWKRECSCTCYSTYTTHPKRKKHIVHLQQEEEEKISPCPVTAQPMEDCQNSANKKSLHLEIPVSSNGCLVYNSPPKSIKDLPLLCFTGPLGGWPLGHMFPNCHSLLFPKKSILLEKYLTVSSSQRPTGMRKGNIKLLPTHPEKSRWKP